VVAILLAGRPLQPVANLAVLARTKGYAYAPYFAKLVRHLEGDDEDKLRVLLGYDEPARGELRAEAVGELFHGSAEDPHGALAHARAVCEAVEPGALTDFERGFYRLVLTAAGNDLRAALERVALAPPGTRERLAEALGRAHLGGHVRLPQLRRELDVAARSPLAEPFARGLGWRLLAAGAEPDGRLGGRWVRYRPDVGEELLEALGGPLTPFVRQGYEAARRASRLP
jgi:hypothetical protein